MTGALPALEAAGLRKVYRARGGGQVVAVDGLSFAVRPGEVVGLLGPNGAGKTTAMQLALALLEPDAGEVRLFGRDPELLEVRRCGMPSTTRLHMPQMPSRQSESNAMASFPCRTSPSLITSSISRNDMSGEISAAA